MTAVRRLESLVLWALLLGLGFSITVAEIALAFLALCWLLRLGEPGRRASLRFPLVAPALTFAGVSLLAAVASADPAGSLVTALKGLLLLAVFYLVLHALPNEAAAARFLGRLLAVLGIVGALAIAQVTACPSDPGWLPLAARFFKRCDRAHAFYSIYMTLAGVLLLVLLAALPRLLPTATERRWWTGPAWASGLVALALTQVRGAWVGFGAGVLALAGLARRGRLLLLGGLVLAVALLLVTPGLRARARSLADPEDPTARERLFMLQSAWAMARDYPLTGAGPGQVKAVYPRYARQGALRRSTSHVHNTPLQILAERGPLGLAAWVWLWTAFFARGAGVLRRLAPERERDRALVTGSLAAITGFLGAGLFEYNFGDSEVVMVAYAVMALPFVVEGTGPLRSA